MTRPAFTKQQLAAIQEIVRDELGRADVERVLGKLRIKPRRFRKCGTNWARNPPQCMGSVMHGSSGCYCGLGV